MKQNNLCCYRQKLNISYVPIFNVPVYLFISKEVLVFSVILNKVKIRKFCHVIIDISYLISGHEVIRHKRLLYF